jgi:hypothetical protein
MIPVSILLLEDSDETSSQDAELMRAQLLLGGFEPQIERVETEYEFRAALDRHAFDLVLADYNLSSFDGVCALGAVRERFPDLPFIFISGVPGEEIAVDAIKHGATDWVLKRRLERLVPAISRALAEAREKSERKRVEDALQETLGRFRDVADSAPVMIWTAGPDGQFDYFNRTWLDFCGQPMEEELGEGWTDGVHREDLDRCVESYRTAFQTRKPFTLECRLRRHDGEYRWIVNKGVPRFSPTGEFLGYIGSCMDISELKRAEERLRHSAKLESLGLLAGGIAHDFNNILTGILGNASLLLDEVPRSSSAAQLVDNVIRASERAAQLSRQMLAYSGKGRFVIEKLDLSTQVREITSLLTAVVSKNVTLRLDLKDGLPTIDADPVQIQQLIMNLVINAAEAIDSPEGMVIISTFLREFAPGALPFSEDRLTPGEYLVLKVRDTGRGMDTGTKDRIFDPFFTTKFAGRGLGLAAVSGIVHGHKGALEVESQLGVGTVFYVYLPVASQQERSPPEIVADDDLSGSGIVLVIDDEDVVRSTARVSLENFGYTPLLAADGREAVALFDKLSDQIIIVVLDLTMPGMLGEDTISQLRAIRADIPIIASSGYHENEAIRRFGAGISGFVQKPYTARQLAVALRRALP